MTRNPLARREFLRALAATGACFAAPAFAQEPGSLKEPVFRVSKANNNLPEAAPAHPLDAAINLANDSLALFRQNIVDYTARIVSRERVNGVVGPYEHVDAQIRNQQVGG